MNLEDQADDVLMWLACDCVERALYITRANNKNLLYMVDTARRFVAGNISRAVYVEATLGAKAIARQYAFAVVVLPERHLRESQKAEQVGMMHQAAKAACKLFSPKKAAELVKEVAQMVSPLIVEQKWVAERSLALKELWKTCGDRTAILLLEGKCPVPIASPMEGAEQHQALQSELDHVLKQARQLEQGTRAISSALEGFSSSVSSAAKAFQSVVQAMPKASDIIRSHRR